MIGTITRGSGFGGLVRYLLHGDREEPNPDRVAWIVAEGEQQKRQRERAEVWSDRMRETLRPHFRESQTWAELEHRLAEQGVSLQKKGRGLVVTDGAHQVKASRIDRGSSSHQLEARFGMPFNKWRAQVEVLQDTVDQIQRTQALQERLASLWQRIAQRIRPNQEVVDHHEELQKWCDRERANLWPYFPRIYRPQDTEMAFKGFLEQMQAEGVDAAAKVLTQTPKRFGRLQGRGVGRYWNEERGLALRNINSAVPVAYRFSELQQRLQQGQPRFRAARLSLRHLRPRIRRIAQAINDLSAGRRIDALEKDLVRLGIQMGVSAVKLALPPQVAQVVVGAVRAAQLVQTVARGFGRGD